MSENSIYFINNTHRYLFENYIYTKNTISSPYWFHYKSFEVRSIINCVVGEAGNPTIKLLPSSQVWAKFGSMGILPKNGSWNSCASASPPPLVFGNNSVETYNLKLREYNYIFFCIHLRVRKKIVLSLYIALGAYKHAHVFHNS